MTYILLAIFLYFVYRFTAGFLLPVIKTTSEVKRKMQQMQAQQRGYAAPDHQNTQQTKSPEKPIDKGEYIEFEEIKD